MRTQSPNENNPANPLFKVAALTLRRVDAKAGRFRKVRIVPSLNFKRSDDLRGITNSADGSSVTVCFSLRIRRASFKITISFEGDEKTNIAQVKKVAFLSPLEVRDNVRHQVSVSRTSNRGHELSGSTTLGIDTAIAKFGGRGMVGGRTKSAQKTKKVGSSVRTFDRTNIAVTHDENVIHWEISSVDDPTVTENEPAFLQGEVFRSRSRNRTLDACVVAWKPDDQKGPLLISWSVYTLMEDLILENIRFQDELGGEVRWNKLEREPWSLGKNGLGPLYGYTKEKERFVEQVIRKHLLSQGMNLEGARVEICKPYT
jgi:hypothetical protein